jgi:hypothetical protein
MFGQPKKLKDALSNSTEFDKKRYLFILGVMLLKEELRKTITSKTGEVEFIFGRVNIIIEAFKMANVYLLPRGQLENYFQINNQFVISNNEKSTTFNDELNFLKRVDLSEAELTTRYGPLLQLLDSVTGSSKVNSGLIIKRYILDFIYSIQREVLLHDISDTTDLKKNKTINYDSYKDILDVVSFSINGKSFKCTIRLKVEDISSTDIEFDENFAPTKLKVG